MFKKANKFQVTCLTIATGFAVATAPLVLASNASVTLTMSGGPSTNQNVGAQSTVHISNTATHGVVGIRARATAGDAAVGWTTRDGSLNITGSVTSQTARCTRLQGTGRAYGSYRRQGDPINIWRVLGTQTGWR